MLIAKRPKLPPQKNLFVHEWVIYADLPERQREDRVAKKLQMSVKRIRMWLEDPVIQAAILHEIAYDDAEHGIDRPNIVRQLSRMTYYDPAQIVDDEGEPRPLHKLDEEIRAAIQGVEVIVRDGGGGDDAYRTITYKYKFCDRNSCMEKVMRYAGLFEKDNAQKAEVLQDMLKQIYEGGSRLPVKQAEIVEMETVEPVRQTVSREEPKQLFFNNPFQ